MSSSVPHSLFLTKQKELGLKEITLVKLSDTRWSCRHASIKAIKTTIAALLATLVDIADESGSRAIESQGQLLPSPFFFLPPFFEKIFSVTGNLSVTARFSLKLEQTMKELTFFQKSYTIYMLLLCYYI